MTNSSKEAISIRVDPGVLRWFRARRKRGYQTLMHEVLEAHVRAEEINAAKNLGRAQELFRHYHTQCFWQYAPDLEITSENLHLVIAGLRMYGGRKGYQLASELCP